MAKEIKSNQYNFSATDINMIKVLLSLPEDHLMYAKLLEAIYGQNMMGNMAKPMEDMKSIRRVIADKEFYDLLDNTLASEPDREHTRRESYEQTKSTTLSNLQQEIYSCIVSSEDPLSRNDICDRLNLRINVVTARVRELIKMGHIRTQGTKWDKETKRNVSLLVVRAV